MHVHVHVLSDSFVEFGGRFGGRDIAEEEKEKTEEKKGEQNFEVSGKLAKETNTYKV